MVGRPTLPRIVMFSATDVAQMVQESDSDYGAMEGGSDVEVEEHVSSFFCKNYSQTYSVCLFPNVRPIIASKSQLSFLSPRNLQPLV